MEQKSWIAHYFKQLFPMCGFYFPIVITVKYREHCCPTVCNQSTGFDEQLILADDLHDFRQVCVRRLVLRSLKAGEASIRQRTST